MAGTEDTKPANGLTYADSGVDIDAGDALVDRIKPLAKATRRAGAAAGWPTGGHGGRALDPRRRFGSGTRSLSRMSAHIWYMGSGTPT